MGRRHLGILSVKGRKRAPWPAASRKAFTRKPCRNGARSRFWSCRQFCRSRKEYPARASSFVTVDEWIIDNDLRSGHIESESHLVNAFARQCLTNGLLVA